MAKWIKQVTVVLLLYFLAAAFLPFSIIAAEEELPPLAEGQHVKWMDRVELPNYAKKFYYVCVEAADNDGYNDFFIQDRYFELASDPVPITFAYLNTLQVGNFLQTEEFTGIFVGAVLQEEREFAFRCVGIAFQAFLHDYPKVFWLGGQWQVWYTDKNTGMAYLFFVLNTPARESSFRYSGYTEETIRAAIAKQDNHIARIIDQIPEEAVKDSEIVTYFHNVLVKNNEYNTLVADALSTNQSTDAIRAKMPIVWEGICALSGNTGKLGPVCYAYAKALKVLCDEVSIPCVITCNQDHVWNYVQIEDNWYAVDTMRDDPAFGSGAVSGFERTDYLLVGSETLDREGIAFIESHPVENRVWIYCGEELKLWLTNEPVLSAKGYQEQ